VSLPAIEAASCAWLLMVTRHCRVHPAFGVADEKSEISRRAAEAAEIR